MAVDTYVERARSRVRSEQEAIGEKLDTYGTFVHRVEELQPDQTQSSVAGITTVGGATHLSGDASDTDGCRTVRTAFDETIRPHSVADVDEPDSVLETIREEFTDGIAAALAPTTDASFTPGLKEAIVATARTRQAEVAALREALDREERQLDDAAAVVDGVTAWVAEAEETPLTDPGFDALERRHETLARHRDRCEDLAHRRQEFLCGTTSVCAEAGIRHRSLVEHLYGEFPVDHPVLATVARLDDTCRKCQRAVRAHLVRRG